MEKLRQRMIEDMKLRGLAASTQTRYLEGVKSLAKHYNRPAVDRWQPEISADNRRADQRANKNRSKQTKETEEGQKKEKIDRPPNSR